MNPLWRWLVIYSKYFDEIFVWFRGSWSHPLLFGTCEIQQTLKMAREMPREGVLQAIYVDDGLQTGMKAPRNNCKRTRKLFIYFADSVLKAEAIRRVGISPTKIFDLQSYIEHRSRSGLTEGFRASHESTRNSLGKAGESGNCSPTTFLTTCNGHSEPGLG
jgi:hypothetical protein